MSAVILTFLLICGTIIFLNVQGDVNGREEQEVEHRRQMRQADLEHDRGRAGIASDRARLESELVRYAAERPVALVLPSLYSEIHGPALKRIVEELSRVPYLTQWLGEPYYIAMPADYIMASPSTLTGSIGVIGGKLNLKGLYRKIGISKEQVSRGKHATLVTDYGPLSPELKEKLSEYERDDHG